MRGHLYFTTGAVSALDAAWFELLPHRWRPRALQAIRHRGRRGVRGKPRFDDGHEQIVRPL